MSGSMLNAVDFFSGAGGMSLGFEQAGFKILGAFDLEQFNVDTYNRNLKYKVAHKADLSKSSADDLRRQGKFSNEEIDVVFGGPPCQGFSTGGLHLVDDERNLLVYDFARLVKDLAPKYFVMENVRGLMAERSKPILDSLLRRMKRAGYNVVTPIKVLNAANYGVPQRRWRTFILGSRKDLTQIAYPLHCGIDFNGIKLNPVVRDALSDLPTLEECDELYESDKYPKKLKKTTNPYALLMRSGNSSNCLTGCLRTKHSTETIKRFSKTTPGSAESISRYIRLDWNSVAPTIRAGTGRDHGSHTAPRPIHPELPRCISTREAARLHSFPDWFEFHGTRWHDFRQIGNSVPPMLAKAVATVIANTLLTANKG